MPAAALVTDVLPCLDWDLPGKKTVSFLCSQGPKQCQTYSGKLILDTTGHFFSRPNLNSLNCQDYLAQLLYPALLSFH